MGTHWKGPNAGCGRSFFLLGLLFYAEKIIHPFAAEVDSQGEGFSFADLL
jgi:hypothetical protein